MTKTTKNLHDLVIGDSKNLVITLLKGSPPTPVNIPTNSVCRALVQGCGMTPIVCLPATLGANWAIGMVSIPFPAIETAKCKSGANIIEIQIDGLDTWFADCEIRKGEIT